MIFGVVGPEAGEDLGEEEVSSDSENEEQMSECQDYLDDLDDEHNNGTMRPMLIDKETNTESKRRAMSEDVAIAPSRGSAIRRSQTFSPTGRSSDYICRVCSFTAFIFFADILITYIILTCL